MEKRVEIPKSKGRQQEGDLVVGIASDQRVIAFMQAQLSLR